MATATTATTVGYDVGSIDITLLRGLEPALSVSEQKYVTTLFTSGNPNDLAAAAKMLYEVGRAIKGSICVKDGGELALSHDLNSDQSESIRISFEKSTDTFITHHFDDQHTKKNYYTNRRPAYNDYEKRVAQEKKKNDYQQEITSTALPLPVRIPRYVVLEPFDPDEDHRNKPMLTFIEDEWNGTLGEAFTKLHIKRDNKKEIKNLIPKIGGLFKKTKKKDDDDDDQNEQQHHHHSHFYTVEKSLFETNGFDEIVNRMDDGYKTKLSEHHQEPRALISHVSHHVGKFGTVHEGDVITHVNGQEFSGGTVEDLKRIISDQYNSYTLMKDNDKKNIRLELVVNAEQCIAQALKLRSI